MRRQRLFLRMYRTAGARGGAQANYPMPQHFQRTRSQREATKPSDAMAAAVTAPGQPEAGASPAVVVVSPPAVAETKLALEWGFAGAAAKSLATIAAYRAECDEQSLPFVDLSATAKVGTDGIHFKAEAARPIAEAVAAALRGALWGVG